MDTLTWLVCAAISLLAVHLGRTGLNAMKALLFRSTMIWIKQAAAVTQQEGGYHKGNQP